MSAYMKRNDHGFTLLEIVVVMVLISIIAAVVYSNSITTHQINFVGEVDKILSQIRYVKSMAMKRSQGGTTQRWGFYCTGSQYILFEWIDGGMVGPKKIPGEEKDIITLEDIGVDMDYFLLFFDNLGRPYSETASNNLTDDLAIDISSKVDPTESRTIVITPETGFIKIQ